MRAAGEPAPDGAPVVGRTGVGGRARSPECQTAPGFVWIEGATAITPSVAVLESLARGNPECEVAAATLSKAGVKRRDRWPDDATNPGRLTT